MDPTASGVLTFASIFQSYVPILDKIKMSLIGDTTRTVSALSTNVSQMATTVKTSITGSKAFMKASVTAHKMGSSQMATDIVAGKTAFIETLKGMLETFKASPFMTAVTKGIASALSYAKRFLTFLKGWLTQASSTQFMGVALSTWIIWAIIAAALLFVIWKIIKWFKNKYQREGNEIPDFILREDDMPVNETKPSKPMGKIQKKFYTSAIDVSKDVGKEIVNNENVPEESGFFSKFLKTVGKFIIYIFVGGIILLVLNHFGLLESLKRYAGLGPQMVANH